MSNKTNSSYFLALIKKGYWIHALLLTALELTFTVFFYQSGLKQALFASSGQPLLFYALTVIAYLTVLTVAYIFATRKKSSPNLCDAIPISMSIFAVAFLVYALVLLNSFNLFQICFIAFNLVVGVLLIIFNATGYNKTPKEGKKPCKCALIIYLKSVFAKFNFIAILYGVLWFACTLLLLLNGGISFNISYPTKLIVLLIYALVILIFMAFGAGVKNTSLADAVLVSATLSLPIIIAQTLFLNGASLSSMKYGIVIFALLLVAVIFYGGLRVANFSTDSVETYLEQKPNVFISYLSQVNAKYNILTVLAVACISLAIYVLFPMELLLSSVNYSAGLGLSISPKLLPLLAVVLPLALGVLFAVVLSLVNLKSKTVTLGDFCTVFLLSLSIFGVGVAILYFSLVCTLALLCLFAFSLCILLSRMRYV